MRRAPRTPAAKAYCSKDGTYEQAEFRVAPNLAAWPLTPSAAHCSLLVASAAVFHRLYAGPVAIGDSEVAPRKAAQRRADALRRAELEEARYEGRYRSYAFDLERSPQRRVLREDVHWENDSTMSESSDGEAHFLAAQAAAAAAVDRSPPKAAVYPSGAAYKSMKSYRRARGVELDAHTDMLLVPSSESLQAQDVVDKIAPRSREGVRRQLHF